MALVARGVSGGGVSGIVDGAGSTAGGGGRATLTLGLARIGGGEADLERQTMPRWRRRGGAVRHGRRQLERRERGRPGMAGYCALKERDGDR